MTADTAGPRPLADDSVEEPEAYVREWREWHRRHEAVRADPHGFLAITGLHWLTAEPRRLPGAPGEWSTSSDRVVVTLAAGEELVVDGAVVRGRHAFDPIPERGGINVVWGD